MNMTFEWAPFLPVTIAAALCAGAAVVLLLSLFRRVPEFRWRAVVFLLVACVLLNPLLLKEMRQSLPDKMVVVMDTSASQTVGARDETAEAALATLQEKLDAAGIEPVVIRAGAEDGGRGEGTNLFAALRNALPGIPLAQVAGTVFITDGQVHDVPSDPGLLEKLGPYSMVMTGDKDEIDRRMTIVSAPKYGLLSQDVTIAVMVEEFGHGGTGKPVYVSVSQDGQKQKPARLVPGEVREFTFRLDHPGQNVFEFSTPPLDGELTTVNNTAPVIVNGVRDRLRVLLVSGAPHMGERAWRNLLKSDPSIDLVHFTILRSITSVDMTDPDEMSLIVFPVEELFRRKLSDFDLVIFDRYSQVSLLTQMYFLNIASYVKQGGAFLMAMGGDSGGEDSIFKTPLASVLPVSPLGEGGVASRVYTPELTEAGSRHPVTAELQQVYEKTPWGQWFTQSQVARLSGETVMTGADGLPLLILDKISDGRVAVLSSDNVWLWSKGRETQGPYSRLLRNTAHWLMKEPELEEDYIKAVAKGSVITVSQRDLTAAPRSVVMTDPTGTHEDVPLTDKTGDGWVSARVEAKSNGIYSFAAGTKKAFVVVGTAANQEFSDVHTTTKKMETLVAKTGGGIVWYRDDEDFSLSALHLKKRAAYAVQSVESRGLIPNPLALLVILFPILLSWWREGGTK